MASAGAKGGAKGQNQPKAKGIELVVTNEFCNDVSGDLNAFQKQLLKHALEKYPEKSGDFEPPKAGEITEEQKTPRYKDLEAKYESYLKASTEGISVQKIAIYS